MQQEVDTHLYSVLTLMEKLQILIPNTPMAKDWTDKEMFLYLQEASFDELI